MTVPYRCYRCEQITLNAAAFAPEALRRASPKLENTIVERRRETAEAAEKIQLISRALSRSRSAKALAERTFRASIDGAIVIDRFRSAKASAERELARTVVRR